MGMPSEMGETYYITPHLQRMTSGGTKIQRLSRTANSWLQP